MACPKSYSRFKLMIMMILCIYRACVFEGTESVLQR